jgi:CHAT domain-containing protein
MVALKYILMKIPKAIVLIGAIIAFCAAASIMWLPEFVGDNPRHAARLLRAAYENRRNLELRWPGARFSPYNPDSGSTGANSLSLLRAQEIISRHKNTSDPQWVQIQGQLAVLLKEPQTAVKLLGNLHDTSPKQVPLLIDLATAYFERGQAGDSDVSYGKSLEFLGEALDQQPENPLVLYDSALVEEELFLYHQSRDHWNAYLALDRTSGWVEEARQHLARITQILEQHEAMIRAPLHTPADLAADGLQDQTLLREVEERIEEYSDVAVQDWLPQAYVADPPGELKIALRELAGELLQKHGDAWLLDFIQAPNSRHMQEALLTLRQSIQANVAGDAVNGKRFAERATALFKVAGSEPGALRAQLEEVNALRLLFKSPQCNSLSRRLEKPLTSHRYDQVLARLELERTSCEVRAGNQEEGLESLRRAEAAVNDGKLGSQRINVINYQSALDGLKDGRSEPLWHVSRRALQLFWAGVFPDKRAYPFYSNLADWAEENDSPFLFYEFAGEAATTIDFTDLISFRAMAHYRFAEAGLVARRPLQAKDQFRQSEKLFRELPQNESVLIHRAGIGTTLASLEAQHGDNARAFALLSEIEPGVVALDSFLVKYEFYFTRALLFAKQKKYSDAEKDYRHAITAAEGSLSSVKDERDRLAWARSYGSAYRGLTQVLIDQSRTDEALQVWDTFRASDLRQFSRNAGSEMNDGANVIAKSQQALGKAVALVYMVADGGLAIWAVSAQKIEFKFLRLDQSALLRRAQILTSLCGDPNSDEKAIAKLAQELNRVLVQPVRSFLSGESIIVEPDDGLASLPFEVLIGEDGRYMIERTSISYLPSLLFINHLRDEERSSGKALVVGVAGVPEPYRKNLPPLPDAENEAREIGAALGSARVLTGGLAEKKSVLRQLTDATIFHFAGHSLYENGRLELLLSQAAGGAAFLDMADLSRTKLSRSQLVVLSACATQGASGETFHQAQNAVRMVLQARVPHTIASRWDVESQTTSEFMKEFYRHFSLEKDTSRSLGLTMNHVRQEHSHPYYWAAFSSFGRA